MAKINPGGGPRRRRSFSFKLCLILYASLAIWTVSPWSPGAPDPAWGATEAGEIFLARGTKLYLDGKYAEAREQLLQGVKADPDDAEIWEFLGLASFSLKKYPEAKEEFTRALSLNPQIPRGKLYLGATYYFLENYPEAERWLKAAKAETPEEGLVRYYLGLIAYQQNRPKEALTELESGLRLAPKFALAFKPYQEALAARPDSKRDYDIAVAGGLAYDDNVKVLPDRSVINPPGKKQYPGHKADWQGVMMLRGEYRPIVQENATLGLRYFTYANLNFRQNPFNVWDQLAEVYYKYRWQGLILEPFYAFDHTLLGGQFFSQFQNAGLRLSFQETPYLVGDVTYLYQNRDFLHQVNPDYLRDGYLNQVGFFQTLALGTKGALRLGFIWQREFTTGINWRAKQYRFPVEVIYSLPFGLTAYFYFEYQRTNADNVDTFVNVLRHDNYYEVDFQLRKPLTPWMDVIAGYAHVRQLSNVPDFAYGRNVYELLLSVRY